MANISGGSDAVIKKAIVDVKVFQQIARSINTVNTINIDMMQTIEQVLQVITRHLKPEWYQEFESFFNAISYYIEAYLESQFTYDQQNPQ